MVELYLLLDFPELSSLEAILTLWGCDDQFLSNQFIRPLIVLYLELILDIPFCFLVYDIYSNEVTAYSHFFDVVPFNRLLNSVKQDTAPSWFCTYDFNDALQQVLLTDAFVQLYLFYL